MPDPDPPDIPIHPDERRRRDADEDDDRRRSDHHDVPHRGGLILALGVASVALCQCCPFLGIGPGGAAWVMGGGDLAAMDAGEMDPAGRSDTRTGRLCGMIGVGLNAAGTVVWVLYAALLIARRG